jgi:UDPglucose 6-dehydrogenase
MEKIAVIGIGRMGLCFALNLEKAGYEVLGIDVNSEYVRSVNNKSFSSPEPGLEAALQSANFFYAHDTLEALQSFPASLLFITVATPAAKQGYDHTIVDDVLRSLYNLKLSVFRKDIVIMCTALPGYCDAKATEALQHNYFISYNPEFIAQGSILQNQRYPDQVLIGEADAAAGDKLEAVYKKLCLNNPAVCRMSPLSAEIAKLATNCFLTMKISFANAIGDLAEKVGADTTNILAAVGADSRIGVKFLQYGFGFGGPCFPRDNRALFFFAEQQGYELLLSAATDEINKRHLHFQAEQYMKKYAVGECIHFYGVTYKPGTIILEESQPLALAAKMANAGRKIIIHEREEVILQLRAEFGERFEYVQETD